MAAWIGDAQNEVMGNLHQWYQRRIAVCCSSIKPAATNIDIKFTIQI